MASKASHATISFYYPNEDGSLATIRNETFFTKPGEGIYDSIVQAFHNNHPLTYNRGGDLCNWTTIYSISDCTACVCEDTSKKDMATGRPVLLTFNDKTASIRMWFQASDLLKVRETVRTAMASSTLVTLSDNYRKTVIVDARKLRRYEETLT